MGDDGPGWDSPMNAEPAGSPRGLDSPEGADRGSGDSEEILAMTRRLARVAELVHTANYYTDEINGFLEDGFRGWWHAYLAYRPAPLGPVGSAPVIAAFYNFAPRMVERAVPAVWDILAPEAVLERRLALMGQAFDRIFGGTRFQPIIAEAAELARAAVHDLDPGARPLSAALAALPWPDDPALQLWHACTIWREYRGDGHNIALAAVEVDGIECHLLMAAAGHGNQPTLAAIRGWNEQEWLEARDRLRARDLLDPDGGYTEAGSRFRAELEFSTDRLGAGPVENLGIERAARLFELLSAVGNHLKDTGEVAGSWPPPAVRKS